MRLFDLTISSQAKLTIGEATPLEIARLLSSFAKTRNAGGSNGEFLSHALRSAGDKLLFHTPAELTTVAFAFGSLLDLKPDSETQRQIAGLFGKVRRYSLSALHLFEFRDLIGMLVTASRWLPLSCPRADLDKFVGRGVYLLEENFGSGPVDRSRGFKHVSTTSCTACTAGVGKSCWERSNCVVEGGREVVGNCQRVLHPTCDFLSSVPMDTRVWGLSMGTELARMGA